MWSIFFRRDVASCSTEIFPIWVDLVIWMGQLVSCIDSSGFWFSLFWLVAALVDVLFCICWELWGLGFLYLSCIGLRALVISKNCSSPHCVGSTIPKSILGYCIPWPWLWPWPWYSGCTGVCCLDKVWIPVGTEICSPGCSQSWIDFPGKISDHCSVFGTAASDTVAGYLADIDLGFEPVILSAFPLLWTHAHPQDPHNKFPWWWNCGWVIWYSFSNSSVRSNASLKVLGL